MDPISHFVGEEAELLKRLGWSPFVVEALLRGMGNCPETHDDATHTEVALWNAWRRRAVKCTPADAPTFVRANLDVQTEPDWTELDEYMRATAPHLHGQK